MIQQSYNLSVFISLIKHFLNAASETSNLIPDWALMVQTIASQYLMPVLLKTNFTEGICK